MIFLAKTTCQEQNSVMPMRVTMSDVAEALGISRATVHRALNHYARISPKTRKRILDMATQMGYQPDPVLSALGRNRWRKASTKTTYSLAFISCLRNPMKHIDWTHSFPAARQEAERLGYTMDFHNVNDYESAEKLGHILYTRGVRGLLISYLYHPPPKPDFDWNLFSSVSLGEGPYTPPIHRVNAAHFQTALMAWQKTIEAGYRRIGGALQLHEPVLSDDYQRMGAFAIAQQRFLKPSEHIPTFCYGIADYERPEAQGGNKKHEIWFAQFSEWFEKYRPEVVIGSNTLVSWWLERMGKKIPKDVAFVAMAQDMKKKKSTDIAGFHMQNPAALAVPFLDMLIRTNQRGIPREIQYLCCSAEWRDGASLPKKHSL